MPTSIDFNCDLGEGCGNDAEIIPHVSSASLACGFHAGNASTLREAIDACIAAGVAIGAHPSFADREHFGRREYELPDADIRSLVLYQLGATATLVTAAGGRLAHVKPHGALYNLAARDASCALAIAQAVHDFDPSLLLYGLSGSALTAAGEAVGLRVVHEVFAERRYEPDGRLTPRTSPDAVIESASESLDQVRLLVTEGVVIARDGQQIALRADSLCLHGDRTDALEFARSLRAALDELDIAVRAPSAAA